MAARTFHVSLVNQSFPFNFTELSSTIIYGTPLEQNRGVPQSFVGRDADLSFGICQAYYLQNVLPTVRGYSSLRFEQMIPPNPIQMVDARQVIVLRGEGNSVALLVVSDGMVSIYDTQAGMWVTTFLPVDKNTKISKAFVKTQTYVCLQELGVYAYSFRDKEFQLQKLKGISAPDIRGIASGGDRLIAHSSVDIAWSSLFDPLDFIPNVDTGAGTTNIIAVRGEIVTVSESGEDFIIYTASNAVYASKTNNVAFPYKFSEIQGSEGIASSSHVTQDSNRGVQITWTASGFQEVSRDGAEYIWPDLSQGIINGQEATIPTGAVFPEIINHNEAFDVRLGFVSNRWIAISVRTSAQAQNGGAFQFAYIFDVLLSRWGKLDIPHYSLVQFTAPDFYIPLTYDELARLYPTYQDMAGHQYMEWQVPKVSSAPKAGRNFGILLPTGAIVRASPFEGMQDVPSDPTIRAKPSKLLLGKFKIFRDQGAILQWIKAIGADSAHKEVHSHDYTGNYIDSYDDFVVNPNHPGQFFRRMNADSFSLGFTGDFHLVDLSIHAADSGSINQRRQYLPDCTTIVDADGQPVGIIQQNEAGEEVEYYLGIGKSCKFVELPAQPVEPGGCEVTIDPTGIWEVAFESEGAKFWESEAEITEMDSASFVSNGKEFDLSQGIALKIKVPDSPYSWTDYGGGYKETWQFISFELAFVRGGPFIPTIPAGEYVSTANVFDEVYSIHFEMYINQDYEIYDGVEYASTEASIDGFIQVTGLEVEEPKKEFNYWNSQSIHPDNRLTEFPELTLVVFRGMFDVFADLGNGVRSIGAPHSLRFKFPDEVAAFFDSPAKILIRSRADLITI